MRNRIDFVIVRVKHLRLLRNLRSHANYQSETHHKLEAANTKYDIPRIYRIRHGERKSINIKNTRITTAI